MTRKRLDDSPAFDCPYCESSFPESGILSLHKGLDHSERLTAEEQTRFEEAHEAERDLLYRYKIIAVGILVAVYFGLLCSYAIFA